MIAVISTMVSACMWFKRLLGEAGGWFMQMTRGMTYMKNPN